MPRSLDPPDNGFLAHHRQLPRFTDQLVEAVMRALHRQAGEQQETQSGHIPRSPAATAPLTRHGDAETRRVAVRSHAHCMNAKAGMPARPQMAYICQRQGPLARALLAAGQRI